MSQIEADFKLQNFDQIRTLLGTFKVKLGNLLGFLTEFKRLSTLIRILLCNPPINPSVNLPADDWQNCITLSVRVIKGTYQNGRFVYTAAAGA